MKANWNRYVLSAVAGMTLVGAGAGAGQAMAAGNITVFAAASLTNALQDIAIQYEKTQPIKIVASFASSSTLARQIEQGAPADLFISADQQWMDYAIDKRLMDNASRVTLLGNDLVLVAAVSEPVRTITINQNTDWKKLLRGQRLSLGDPDHVPAGRYAKEALQNLGAWSTVSTQLAPGHSVRAALALVERNEAPFGIVYGSDAVVSNKVRVVAAIPESSHKPVEYAMAITKDHNNADVQAFYNYLRGAGAATVFKKYGFIPRT